MDEKKEILISDPLPLAQGHTYAFNQAFINIVSGADLWKRIIFLSSKETIKKINLKHGNKNYQSIGGLRNYRPKNDHQILSFFKLIYNYFKTLKTSNSNTQFVLFTHAEVISFAIFLFLLPASKTKRIGLINQLPHYVNYKKRYSIFLKYVINNIGKFFVFEEEAKQILEKNNLLKPPYSNLYVLNHPPYWANNENCLKQKKMERFENKDLMNISYVGSLAKYKGVDNLLDVLEVIRSNEELNRYIKVNIFGKMSPELLSQFDKYKESININLKDEYIDYEKYDEVIDKSHFIFLLHKEEFYPKVSGIFYDAMKLCTPVFASDNSMWVSYFKKFDNLGLMIEQNNKEEIYNALYKMINLTSDEYYHFLKNINDFRLKRSLNNISQQLKNSFL